MSVVGGGDADPPPAGGGGPQAVPRVTVQQSLSARARWEERAPADYRFTLRRRCYCAPPNDVRIDVAGGRVVAVAALDTGTALASDRLNEFPTIAELLRDIDAAVARQPDSLLIEYDRHLGYPKRVRIDFSYRIADEEIDYRIEDVELR